jgi:MFS transporter, DHA1 family, inner membrane transport protein
MRSAPWTISRIAAVMTVAVTLLANNVLPAVTGVLARSLGFGTDVLGNIASGMLLGAAVGGFGALALRFCASPRMILWVGLTISVVANLAVCRFPTGIAIVWLCILGGVGTGLAVSACYYVFGLEEEEKNSAAGLVAQTALSTLVITAIPIMTTHYGWRAVFIGFAVLALPCMALAGSFPRAYLRDRAPEGNTASASSERGSWALVSVVLSGISIMMVWPYLDRMGAEAAIPQDSIDRALTLSTVSGLISSGIAICAGRRITVPLVLALCTILYLVGTLAIGSATPCVYIAGATLFYLPLPVYLSAQFAIVMRGASSKRFALSYSIALQATGLGPLVGARLAAPFGFGGLRAIAMLTMLLSSCILWVCVVCPKRRASSVTLASE